LSRLIDVALAGSALLLLSPLLAFLLLVIFLHDFRSPLYRAPRVGRGGRMFRMTKLRSMYQGADRTGVSSTAADDARVTPIGRVLRRLKLDEVPQLWNVLVGDMTLVGPRPNVKSGVDAYTDLERQLLSLRPGVTDLASIVFSDEGEILRGSTDPDADYDRFIRPWKNRIALIYVGRRTLALDAKIVWMTILALISRPRALDAVARELAALGAEDQLVSVARRSSPLPAASPPS